MTTYETKIPTKKNTFRRKNKLMNKKRITGMDLVKSLRSIKKNIPWPETKHIDTIYNTATTTGGDIFPITLIAQGIDDNERISNEVRYISILMRLVWVCADSVNVVRLILFNDNSSGGAVPLVTELLDVSVVTTFAYSPLNLNNSKRFKVLYDNMWALSLSGSNIIAIEKEYIKLKRHPISTFLGTAANQLSQGQNQLYILVVSDSGVTTHPTPYVATRVRYVDN